MHTRDQLLPYWIPSKLGYPLGNSVYHGIEHGYTLGV